MDNQEVILRQSQFKQTCADASRAFTDWCRMLPTRQGILPISLAIFLAAVPFFYRYVARDATSPDPFIYGHIAQEILAGKRLYTETWQDKPPLTFLVYAIPRIFGFKSYGALGFLLGVALVAQGLIFFAAFRRNLPVALGCLLFITLFPMTDEDWAWPSSEHFVNPLIAIMLLMAYFISRDKRFAIWQCAALGAVMVVAFHIRQNCVLPGILPVGAICLSGELPRELSRRKLIGLGVVALTALIGWGLILLLVMCIGDLPGYFYTVFQYPHAYMQGGSWASLSWLLRQPITSPLPVFLALFAGLALMGRHRVLVIASCIIAIIICIVPKRDFMHYWANLFPFIACYLGIGLSETNIASRKVQWAVFGAIAFTVAINTLNRFYIAHARPSYADYLAVAAAADAQGPPGATLLVYGHMPSAEAIVFASNLPAANTYCYMFQFRPPYPGILPKPIDTIVGEYLAHPPDVIAIDQQYLEYIRHVDDPDYAPHMIRLLIGNHPYRTKQLVGKYAIVVLDRNP